MPLKVGKNCGKGKKKTLTQLTMWANEVSKRFTKNEREIEKPEGKDEDKQRLFQGVEYRIENLSNADISDFFVYRRVYRIEPPISSITIFSKPVIFLSFFAENSPKILRKFRKFAEISENSPKILKIRRKFIKKKVFL